MKPYQAGVGGLVAAVALSAVAVAQQTTDGPYVLHEFFVARDVSSGGAAPTAANPVFGPGRPPELSLETQAGEPIYAQDGPVFDQPIAAPYGPLTPFGGANTLDDRTDRVDSLTYYANFDPSVIPYKRVVVQNHPVRRETGAYAVEVTSGPRAEVPIGQRPVAEMDLFWGTFLLRLEANRWHPIASVAPDQRVLTVQTEPDIALEIYKDDADNYFVRSPHEGLVRMNIHLAAPQYYFSGEFDDIEWEDLQNGEVPRLAADVRAQGLAVANRLEFGRAWGRPRQTLLKMIEYFRDFDARPFPEDLNRGDLYEAIATHQIGVCRHRSLAFVITAQSLGIPARYVYNEAHAFVEVYWPSGGWRRVDLGGAADELNASANNDKSLHDYGRDALPTPKRYLDEQQRMARNGWDAPSLAGGPDGRGTGDGDGGPVEGLNGGSTNGGSLEGPGDGPAMEADGHPEIAEPELEATPPPTDERTPTRLQILDATAIVRRGGEINLEVRLVEDGGRAIPNRPVEVYLGPVGSTAVRDAKRLGEATTDANGRISTKVVIPREHAIGRWSLFVVFAGDEQYRPTVAE